MLIGKKLGIIIMERIFHFAFSFKKSIFDFPFSLFFFLHFDFLLGHP